MFKVLDEVCKPTKGSKYSAGIDLYSREDIIIGAGETVKVPLGVCIDENFFMYEIGEINVLTDGTVLGANSSNKINKFIQSHYLQLEPRSSLRAKGLIAGTGIIDLDYKDEIMIILHNPSEKWYVDKNGVQDDNEDYKISKGDKIAQILLKEHKTYLMGIDTEEERTGGFGSTGN